MKNRPYTVIIVSILFIVTGIMGFFYHLKDISEPGVSYLETVLVLVIRIVAVICGILLFLRFNWARYLAIAWLLYHVILGAFHSTSEFIMHLVLLILVTVLLFLPVSERYFKKGKKLV